LTKLDAALANRQNGKMQTTVELPDELVHEIELRAEHEGKDLKEAVADLLRKGLDATAVGPATVVMADQASLDRRREIAEKFISGEWGVELSGFEAGRAADREAARERSERWRT
jgi:hypothetical protein